MKEIITDSCTVLTEKKSKFITRLYKISSVQQVDEILKEIRALEKELHTTVMHGDWQKNKVLQKAEVMTESRRGQPVSRCFRLCPVKM